jgi:hypothetical protein
MLFEKSNFKSLRYFFFIKQFSKTLISLIVLSEKDRVTFSRLINFLIYLKIGSIYPILFSETDIFIFFIKIESIIYSMFFY